MWKRECSKCGAEQVYKSERTYLNAKKSGSVCKKCSNRAKARRKGDCSILLNDNPLTYYWLGFIMADGHFYKYKRLKVALGSKDRDHLLKLKDFLKVESHRDYPAYSEFSVMDSESIGKLCMKFHIQQNKTEKPCNICWIKKDLITALFIGFIDGDGSIRKQTGRKDACIWIKCHRAWLGNLDIFSQAILGRNQAYLNKDGYANLNIGNHLILKQLKQYAIDHQLPKLERKWNNINL